MSISVSAIIKGISYKLKRKQKTSHFPAINWIQEKTLKHEDDKLLKTLTVGNLTIKYRRPYELLHTYKELFEEEIYKFPSQTKSPFIVDCGANIGLSVLYFKSLYPEATVIAFEPDEDNFNLLKQNCNTNRLTNVECRKTAVWINNEILSFSSEGTQGSQIAVISTKNTISVKGERLAELLKQRQIDFLKIDIEGAEVDVIKDCAPYLGNVKNLFVEYHGKVDETAKFSQLMNVLKENYKVYIKMAADNLLHPFLQSQTKNSFDVQLNIFCYQ